MTVDEFGVLAKVARGGARAPSPSISPSSHCTAQIIISAMVCFILLLLFFSLASASITLSVSPTTFSCGGAVTLTYSSVSVTKPLKVYLQGYYDRQTYSSLTLPDQSTSFSWTPSGCSASGSYNIYVQDSASFFATSSNSVTVTIVSPSSPPAPPAIRLSVSPTTFYCGDTVTLTYSATGALTKPLTVYLKGSNAITASASLVLPDFSLNGQTSLTTWKPTGCSAAGSWFFFVQDSAFSSPHTAAPCT